MNIHSLQTILIIVLIVVLISSIPRWPYNAQWGWSPAAVVLVIILILLIAGCSPAPTKSLTVHQRIETACVSGGVAEGVITTVNNLHPLTASQQAMARKTRSRFDKRCKLAPGQDYPYSMDEILLDELEKDADTLKTIKNEVQP